MAVHLADIDAGEPAVRTLATAASSSSGIFRSLARVVERAERQDAQRMLPAHKSGGNRAQGAVAPTGHHRLAALCHRLARQLGQLVAVAGKDHARLAAMTGEEVGDLRARAALPGWIPRRIENAGDDGRSGHGIVEHLPS